MNASTSSHLAETRIHRGILVGAVLVLVGIVGGVTWPLRSALHQQVLRREATAMAAVVEVQQETGTQQVRELGLEPEILDVFYALLESPRLEGVVAMQMFEPSGEIAFAVPDSAFVETLPPAEQRTLARAHYHADSSSAGGMGWGQGVGDGPWLEVVVPVAEDTSENHGWVRYWLNGSRGATELAEIDRRLWQQAGISAAGGGLILLFGLGWAFSRLRRRSADLARANQELLLNSKTAAIGAISAHLMHGLNNPLAGLEGFISDESPENAGAATSGEAWAAAAETTRRVRRMVNEVMAVLQDETAGGDFTMEVQDVLDAAADHVRANPGSSQIEIAVSSECEGVQVSGRVASLTGLVINNLTDNAVAATTSGGQVELRAEPVSAELAVIKIIDTGPGLPDEVRAAAFAPVTSRKPGGAGIGLALSGALAKHAGGELRIGKSDTQGTTFILEVPIQSSLSTPS